MANPPSSYAPFITFLVLVRILCMQGLEESTVICLHNGGLFDDLFGGKILDRYLC